MTRRPIPIKVNPDVLIWARKSTNKTIDEIAQNIGITSRKIDQWEKGGSQPTYNQLEDLAYKAYKRPIAVLFRSLPPQEEQFSKDFRSIKPSSIYNCSSELFLAIREAKYLQSAIYEVIEDNYHPNIFDFNPDNNPKLSAQKLRKFIGLKLETQKSWKPNESLSRYKELIENLGIFIFQLNFPFNDARGFSLYGEFPIIVINQNDSPNGRIFTIFHELYHIILKSGNIFSESNLTYSRGIENLCNSFASEFLVPEYDFITFINKKDETWDDEELQYYANIYKVSKEVILRKLIDQGFSTWEFYNQKRIEWLVEWNNLKLERNIKQKKDDKPFMISQAQKVVWKRGKPLIKSTISSFEKGKISLSQVQEIFGVKIEHLDKIIEKTI